MVYGYIRVSTDKQTVENQRYEIRNFVRREKLGSLEWIEETISGAKDPKFQFTLPRGERLAGNKARGCGGLFPVLRRV